MNFKSEIKSEKFKNKVEADDYNTDSQDSLDQAKRYENERYREDTKGRKYLSIWAGKIVTIYLTYVAVILPLNFSYLHLSDAVLITLLGTTTLNVIGLMYIVLKGYFAAKR